VSLSVGNLLELMLLISDNSAADILMKIAGGPEAVTAQMREIGIVEMDVHRPTIRLLEDQAGVVLPAEPQWRPGLLDSLENAAPPESVAAAARRFETDPRDTATPDAIVDLLRWIHSGEGLSAGSRSLLLDVMARCQTGEARLKGMLPDGTAVAHKTGTIGGTANDAGIITLPDGAGHVAVAVCVKGSDREVAVRERAIAQIARAVYDYFLFLPAGAGP
jgi:beta-lactamase class A